MNDLYYTKQIKQHMDLQIIQNKLTQHVFSNFKIANFIKELLLIFNNVIVYYPYEALQNSIELEIKAIIVRGIGKNP